MRRRESITLLGGAAAWPLAARAQQPEHVRRIGIHKAAASNDAEFQARIEAFLQTLQQLGWSIGRNVRIDARWAATNAGDIRGHAAELAALAPGAWQLDHGAVAASDPHRADRVPGPRRSGQCRLRR
jgi:putative tryptophan/tyrosine transport system substrate-binding protein